MARPCSSHPTLPNPPIPTSTSRTPTLILNFPPHLSPPHNHKPQKMAKPEPATPSEHAPVPASAPSPLATQLRSFAAGGFGGVCAVVVGHPFDLVKVRLQTAESGVYKGAIDVVKKSIARDGLRRGLYAGVSAPLIGVTPMCRSPPSLFPCVFLPFAASKGQGDRQTRHTQRTEANIPPQSPSPSGATTSARQSSAPRPRPPPPPPSQSARPPPRASSPRYP